MGRGAGSRAASPLPLGRHDGSNDVLPGEHYDIVVIGGGITGAGIARDAALRGLKVALFEKRDFGSGTSSKSSKLIHGGLRYLEQGELKLVFEGTSERACRCRSRRTSCGRSRSWSRSTRASRTGSR